MKLRSIELIDNRLLRLSALRKRLLLERRLAVKKSQHKVIKIYRELRA